MYSTTPCISKIQIENFKYQVRKKKTECKLVSRKKMFCSLQGVLGAVLILALIDTQMFVTCNKHPTTHTNNTYKTNKATNNTEKNT